jgi:hypothetical protein
MNQDSIRVTFGATKFVANPSRAMRFVFAGYIVPLHCTTASTSTGTYSMNPAVFKRSANLRRGPRVVGNDTESPLHVVVLEEI